jgi:hypothetical protein
MESNAVSYSPVISADGNYIAFESDATNLVSNDTNNVSDIFVREWIESTPTPTNTFTPIPAPSSTNTPPAGATFTPTATRTPTPTSTNTPPPGASLTPTPSATDADVFIPLVLRQYAFATPVPTTPTPTSTPQPVCEVVDHEPNNVFLDADDNLPLCQGVAVNGSVAPTTDVNDIYRILVEQTGTVVVSLSNLPVGADYDLYLYDERGGSGQIGVSNTPGSANEEIRVNVQNGRRYYIRVVSLQYAGPNTYQLRWLQE